MLRRKFWFLFIMGSFILTLVTMPAVLLNMASAKTVVSFEDGQPRPIVALLAQQMTATGGMLTSFVRGFQAETDDGDALSAAMGSATVQIGSAEVEPGDTVTLPIMVNLPPDTLLGAAGIVVDFDSTVLDATSCQRNTELDLDIAICNANASDGVSLQVAEPSGLAVEGDFMLAEITFQAVGQAGESSPLDIEIQQFTDASSYPIEVTDVDGQISIPGAPTETPTATYTASATATHTASPTATYTASPIATYTATVTQTPGTVTDDGADLQITISDSSDPVMKGDPLTYLVSVSNDGPNRATAVTVFSSLPESVTLLSATPSQGHCLPNAATCDLGTLENGQTATITMVVTTPTEPGKISYTANVSTGTADPNDQNNRAVEETSVSCSNEVTLQSVSPPYGVNDQPAHIYINGCGFTEPVTVKLGERSLLVTHVDPILIVAIVPSGLEPGFYDLHVEAPAGEDRLAQAYQVFNRRDLDGLNSWPQWLWSEPFPLRLGYTNSGIGLLVQYLGGQDTIDHVTVEFRLDSASGEVLGRVETPPLDPFTIKSTEKLIWEPEEAGEYRVCAIIDPDNEIEEDSQENNVVCRTLTVLPFAEDISPPEVNHFEIADGDESTSERDVTLDVSATDHPIPGGSGVNAIKYLEFEYISSAFDWVMVHQSEWIPYQIAQTDYPWTLYPTYGVRYMEARAVDEQGNISSGFNEEQVNDRINLLPSTQSGSVGLNGVVVYRMYVEAGQNFEATLAPESGDADLYIWGPDGARWYSDQDTGVEEITFDAPITGTYQIEIYGYTEAQYRLTFDATTSALRMPFWPTKRGPKPLREAPAVPLDVSPQFYNIEPPTTEPTTPTPTPTPPTPEPDHMLYLPIIIN